MNCVRINDSIQNRQMTTLNICSWTSLEISDRFEFFIDKKWSSTEDARPSSLFSQEGAWGRRKQVAKSYLLCRNSCAFRRATSVYGSQRYTYANTYNLKTDLVKGLYVLHYSKEVKERTFSLKCRIPWKNCWSLFLFIARDLRISKIV